MAERAFDLVVIGAGPGGYVSAIRGAQLGLKVAIVEREHMGGICLNWGCIPTKAMLRSAEVFHLMQRAKEFGLSAKGIDYDLEAVVARSRGIAKQLNQGVGFLMKKNKITTLMGEARISSATRVHVTTKSKTETLKAKHIILATGARARELPGLEADGDLVWTYKHALTPSRMPKKLLVIGSGAIGIEFASFYNTLGTDTTVVEVMDRILPVEDAEISAFAKKQFEKQGMHILEKAMVKKLDRAKGKVTAHIEQAGKITTETFDTVISAVGILGNVENLGLEDMGIAVDRSHIVTDACCRTAVAGVYAIGDVARRQQFTHIAGYHAGIVIRNILFKIPAKLDDRAVPWVTYCDPELAHVGLVLDDAAARFGSDQVICLETPLSGNDRAIADRRSEGIVKVLTHKNGRILGASILAPAAGEMILAWSHAIATKAKIGSMASLIAPYPTYGDSSKRAAGSFFTAKLFSPATRRFVRFLLKF